jgi:hypothetical protein
MEWLARFQPEGFKELPDKASDLVGKRGDQYEQENMAAWRS